MNNIKNEENRKCIIQAIEKCINLGRNKFVIYTYGDLGKYTEKILREEYHLLPEYRIDNYKSDGKSILTLDEAAEQKNHEVVFLICSDNRKVFYEIRSAIYSKMRDMFIVDIFEDRATNIFALEDALQKINTYVGELEYE